MIGRISDIQRVRMVKTSLFEKVLRIQAICLRQLDITLLIWGTQLRLLDISTPRSLIWGLDIMGWLFGVRKVGVGFIFLPKWMCSNLSPLKTALFAGAHG